VRKYSAADLSSDFKNIYDSVARGESCCIEQDGLRLELAIWDNDANDNSESQLKEVMRPRSRWVSVDGRLEVQWS
jgi:hypothetical protein